MKNIIKISVFAMLILGLMGFSLTPALAIAANAEGKVRVFVEFAPGKKSPVKNALSAAGGQVHYEFDSLNSVAVSLPAAALNGISRNPNVISIEEDAPRQIYGSGMDLGDLYLSIAATSHAEEVPYGVDSVQARDIWDVNRDGAVDAGAVDGSGRTVCIIDTGFYAAHSDSSPNAVGGYSQIPGEVWNEDGNGHGTHVAGTIAAEDDNDGVIGVAPGVSLYIVKIFNNDGVWTNSSDLIDAINRCASGGANVISMSLGGDRNVRSERNAFASMFNSGVLSIAAAGNDGNTRNSYPASYDSVVSVAAIDSNNNIADFSQQNSQVEVAAPGVSVLSTVPYLSASSITVDGVEYSGGAIEFAALGSASGGLVNGGLCDSVGSWSGKVVLCERGVISFNDKVQNGQSGGANAVVIYNNAPGGFAGTLGAGNTSNIPAISLSQEDGQFLVANKLGLNGAVNSTFTSPASGYEYYDGTSMATPHVSAVAALIWSANPSWTNQQIRDALGATALDLGVAGRDNAYGYGLVQAYDALVYLQGGTNPTPTPTPDPTGTPDPGGAMHVSAIDMSSSKKGPNNTVLTTVTVVDAGGSPVSGATVSLSMTLPDGSGASGTGTTGSDGSVTFSLKSRLSGTYTSTVTGVTHGSYSYDSGANVETSDSLNVP